MIYKVDVTERAYADAEDYFEGLALRSRERAERWYRGLIGAFDSLAKLPRRCPIAAESGTFPHEIRELLHGKRPHVHRIIYKIEGEAVVILFVHHASRGELSP